MWAYNRFMDAVMMLLRRMFMISCGHYVDDLNGEEPGPSAQSAF